MDPQLHLSRMEDEMRLRNMSPKTVKSYLSHIERFLSFIEKPPDSVTEQDIKRYVSYFFVQDGRSCSAVRQFLSSIQFLSNIVLKRNILYDVPYPKKERKLPTVLSKQEISRLFSATSNPKHQLLLKLIYSCGLRVSEAVRIKTTDIDLYDRILHIRKGKGKQDRLVPIPASLLQELQEFLHPEDRNPYLFKARPDKQGHLTISSVQKMVRNLSKRARIKKRVHPHTLRHSFATHLLDQGTDIRYIQEFLGHKRISTTELYTHVSKVSLKGIKNPIEGILQQKATSIDNHHQRDSL